MRMFILYMLDKICVTLILLSDSLNPFNISLRTYVAFTSVPVQGTVFYAHINCHSGSQLLLIHKLAK
jgi:hypothetical protein